VTIWKSAALPDFPETRCANSRPSPRNSTISPFSTLSLLAGSITRVSPGKIAGNMLHPVTRRRKRPDELRTSPASSHFRACTSAEERPGIGSRHFGIHVARGLGRIDLAAGQGCGDKNLLVAEGWLLIRLFMVGRRERLFEGRMIHRHLGYPGYCNADCDACTAQPTLVAVPHVA